MRVSFHSLFIYAGVFSKFSAPLSSSNFFPPFIFKTFILLFYLTKIVRSMVRTMASKYWVFKSICYFLVQPSGLMQLIVKFNWICSRRILNFTANDHTTLNIPVLVRSLKPSSIGRGQYLDG